MPYDNINVYDEYDQDSQNSDDDDYPVIVEPIKYGHNCTKCGELFPHAEANQSDGTLICWGCQNFG